MYRNARTLEESVLRFMLALTCLWHTHSFAWFSTRENKKTIFLTWWRKWKHLESSINVWKLCKSIQCEIVWRKRNAKISAKILLITLFVSKSAVRRYLAMMINIPVGRWAPAGRTGSGRKVMLCSSQLFIAKKDLISRTLVDCPAL